MAFRARPLLGLLHRWAGLFTAVFLFIAGVTGAVIAWHDELDAWLNPAFHVASSGGSQRPALALANALETRHPDTVVTYLPLITEPGKALQVWVEPRPATTSTSIDFNQVAVDPTSGLEQARRYWGAVSLSRENILPFLYRLHYSLQLPVAGGYDIGSLFMGVVAIVWALDAFVALWLSFPNLRSWRKSFAFRWSRGSHALTFDLHRSGGVWIWALMLVLAITAVSMNLRTQVMAPVVSLFSPLTPMPYDAPAIANPTPAAHPGVDRERIVALARDEAGRRGWPQPGAIAYLPASALYGIGFFRPEDAEGDLGLGNPWLYFDARDGHVVGAVVPGQGSAGDLFMQAQFPIHSGRILGLGGRILVSALGLAIAALSATGLLLWLRKRRAKSRMSHARPDRTRSSTMPIR